MQFKTSWFNPSLAKNQLRRFWPLPVCATLALLLILVLPYYSCLRELTQQYGSAAAGGPSVSAQGIASDASTYLSGCYYLMCVLMAGAALGAAMLLFHHLHSRREIQFYLGLPVNRGGLFGTCAVMGFLFIALPLLLSCLAVLFLSVSFQVGIHAALLFFAGVMLCFLCFYGMALTACVMAGQSFGAFLLYCGMHGAVAAIWLGACQVGQYFIPGFDGSQSESIWISWLVPMVRLMSVDLLPSDGMPPAPRPGLELGTPLIYGLLGLGLWILAAVLYQHRRAETAGEMISFSWTRWLSKIMAAMAVGLGGTLVLTMLLPGDSNLSFGALLTLVLVITAIGWISAEMIIRKSFRVLCCQSLIPCGILLVAMAALMVGARADMTGYIHRLPDQSEIGSASVSVTGGVYNYAPVSPEDARTIHETMLSNLDQLSNRPSGNYISVAISYGLKNGTTMDRTYFFSEDNTALADSVASIMDKPENVYSALFPNWPQNPDSLTFRDCVVTAYVIEDGDVDHPGFTRNGSTDPHDTFTLNAQEAQTLYHAVCQDIQEGNLVSHCRQFLSGNASDILGNLSLTLWDPASAAKDPGNVNWFTDIQLLDTMTHTIAAMEELGFRFPN